MAEGFAELNYQFNQNLHLGKSLTQNLRSTQDRQRVLQWLRKLSNSNRNEQEMTIRNEFMFQLLANLRNGELLQPFNDPPPSGPLPAFAQMLPGGNEPGAASKCNTKGSIDPKSRLFGSADEAQRPLLYKHSPDGGAFLAAQPIPKCGAFCYLAVIAKPKE